MIQRSTYTAPILSFDGSHTQAQHTARSALLMALRELPATTFTMIAETPRKRYSAAHDEAARILAEHLILSMSRHIEMIEREGRPGHR
jgi:hypothetical protein